MRPWGRMRSHRRVKHIYALKGGRGEGIHPSGYTRRRAAMTVGGKMAGGDDGGKMAGGDDGGKTAGGKKEAV